ncbi:MAG: hypothetical protein ACI80H_001275 [Pseudoalteromonas distincta]|jgi:hypothetical protein
MKNLVMMVVVLASSFGAYAQYRVNGGASAGPGAAMFTLGVEREFNVFSDKFHINPGVRLSVYNGNDLEYITAPAEYTSNDDQIDTLNFGTVQNNFANLYVRLGYDITEKFSISFDIDVVGVSFGSEQNYSDFRQGAALRAQPQTALGYSEKGSPTTFNLLLVGDNDIGSLNSTLNISYDVTKRLGIDLGVGLIFTEYTIVTGRGYDGNDRFRNKNMMGYLGISYLLGDK